MVNIWERGAVSYDDTGSANLAILTWLKERPAGFEALSFSKQVSTKEGILTLVDTVTACLPGCSVSTDNPRYILIHSEEGFVALYRGRGEDEYPGHPEQFDESDVFDFAAAQKTKTTNVVVTGPRGLCKLIFDKLDSTFDDAKQATVKWWYKGDHGETTYKNIYLPKNNTKLLPEFYPDLEESPAKFLGNYLKSDSSVLLIAGGAGTGKTTLLRHLICDFNLGAHVVYDEVLMNTDQVFQAFLFEEKSDLLIIEDADTILSEREHSGNKLMARFLNVSDGLIKLPNKKVVFTTNLTDFGRIDPALVRPGRCFATLHTRALNLPEATAAAQAAGLATPLGKGEYTLAQLFNDHHVSTVRKIGFV